MPGWSLVAISLLWGLAASWVFRRFTDRVAVRTVRKRLYAHLLEICLFSDEPSLVWRAQKALLADNGRFLKLTAAPALIMAIPFAFLYAPLDSIYGYRPVEVGHSAVVTLQPAAEPLADGAQYVLHAPPGIAVETPAVRNFADRQISWRIRALMPVRGNLLVDLPGGGMIARSIAAGDRTVSPNRRRESAPGVEWVDVDYPRAEVGILGISLHWLAWFLIVSTASAAVFSLTSGKAPRLRTARPILSA